MKDGDASAIRSREEGSPGRRFPEELLSGLDSAVRARDWGRLRADLSHCVRCKFGAQNRRCDEVAQWALRMVWRGIGGGQSVFQWVQLVETAYDQAVSGLSADDMPHALPSLPLAGCSELNELLLGGDWDGLRRRICGMIRHSWGLPSDAGDDVAQESFLIIWQMMADEPESFECGELDWDDIIRTAFGVARNKRWEARKAEHKNDRIEDQGPAYDPVAPDSDRSYRAVCFREMCELAAECLKEKELKALDLLLDGRTREEIASELGWTSTTAKQMVYNITSKIKRKLTAQVRGNGSNERRRNR